MNKQEKSQRRQLAYLNRARSARLYGKLLIPVALVALSTSLWSDPVLGPQLEAGVDEMQPFLASYAQNTPLDGVFGPLPEPVEAQDPAAVDTDGNPIATEEAALALTPNLPTSQSPVNRP